MPYVSIRSEPGLYTVGFHDPQGKWISNSDHDSREAAEARVHYLNGGNSTNSLTTEELTARFYQVKEQRDRFRGFCQAVCPTTGDGSLNAWDHETGMMFRELMKKDRLRLLNFLDAAASYCPVDVQDKVRSWIAREDHNVQPSRLLEALKAIADPEHCLTTHTTQGLRDIATAALQEIDPKNDYSIVHKDECSHVLREGPLGVMVCQKCHARF